MTFRRGGYWSLVLAIGTVALAGCTSGDSISLEAMNNTDISSELKVRITNNVTGDQVYLKEFRVDARMNQSLDRIRLETGQYRATALFDSTKTDRIDFAVKQINRDEWETMRFVISESGLVIDLVRPSSYA